MPSPGQEIRFDMERLDGGLNTKDSPGNLQPNESPDCLNVIFNRRGGVETRKGSVIYNTTTPIGTSAVIDGMANYNETMIVWAGGDMYRMSGTIPVVVSASTGIYTSGVKVAHVVYQNQLLWSNGYVGPYRYNGDDYSYRLGIGIPSAPTGISNVSAVGSGGTYPSAGTWYYAIAYRNTSVVEGEPGSASVAVTLTGTSAVYVTGIPIPAASMGIADRLIYRSSLSAGPYRRVGVLSNVTATIFTDTMGYNTWSVATLARDDGSSPTPWTTVAEHKETLWFDDSTQRTLLRFTNYAEPEISEAYNYIPLSEGDYSNITAIGIQDDFITVFKDKSIWIVDAVTPGSPETYGCVKAPANLGIVGPRAFVEWEGGILFAGKWNGNITGIHNISGAAIQNTTDSKMRSNKLSRRIEESIMSIPLALQDDIAMVQYKNAIYVLAGQEYSTYNDHIFWFDVNRISDTGDPGSWSLWDGRPCQGTCFVTIGSDLYVGSSLADGRIIKLEQEGFADPEGGYNSYWWSKQIGGDKGLEKWFKDWRKCTIFYGLPGEWNFEVRYKEGGDPGDGTVRQVSCSPGGSIWGSFTFDGSSLWGGQRDAKEYDVDLGTSMYRRIQIGFDNGYSASAPTANSGVGFVVYQGFLSGYLRRYNQ